MQDIWNSNGETGESHQIYPFNSFSPSGAPQYYEGGHYGNQGRFQNGPVSNFELSPQINNQRNFKIPNTVGHHVLQNSHKEEEKPRGLFETYGISNHKPKHHQFAVLAKRLESYHGFPSEVVQTPEMLAKAGFFYSGKGDVVFCFFCGQGLKSWEPNDDPWVEHARWAPSCVYLLNMKGKDFVEMIQIAHNNPEQEYIQQEVPMEGLDTTETKIGKNEKDCVDSSQRRSSNFLETIAAQSLLTNGYEEEKVKLAIETFISSNGGNTSFGATDLLQTLFGIEDGSIKPRSLNDARCLNQKKEIKDQTSVTPSQSQTPTSVGDLPDVAALRNENQHLKDQTLCKICLEEMVSIVFLPCGHLCSCAECAPALRKCPICRTFIKGTVKTFLT